MAIGQGHTEEERDTHTLNNVTLFHPISLCENRVFRTMCIDFYWELQFAPRLNVNTTLQGQKNILFDVCRLCDHFGLFSQKYLSAGFGFR